MSYLNNLYKNKYIKSIILQEMSYTWSQTSDIVTITVDIENIDKLDIIIKPNYIRINHILEGELSKNIYPDESVWYYGFDKKTLIIELMKVEYKDFEGVWDRLFVGDEIRHDMVELNSNQVSNEFLMEQQRLLNRKL